MKKPQHLGIQISDTKETQHFRNQIPKFFPQQNERKISCVGRESNPGQLLGRQLCSPLYHRRFGLEENEK